MRLRLRVLGVTVCSFTVDTGPLLELLDEGETYQPDADPNAITGGTSHNFERDCAPLSANHEEPWYEDRFGFQS